MSLAGFDFQGLNRKYIAQPSNDATAYGASIVGAPTGTAWRCIGVYHLKPNENRGRHNVFVDVLDEAGNRTQTPTINWTWYMDAPTQVRKLDKPNDEPACDIPLEKSMTITLRVDGGSIPSDSVGTLHSRHNDEGQGNTWGHHSFYVVFQKRSETIVVIPPDPIDPPPSTDLEKRVTAAEAEIKRLSDNVAALWKVIDDWQAGK